MKCCHGYLYFSNIIHAEMAKVVTSDEIERQWDMNEEEEEDGGCRY